MIRRRMHAPEIRYFCHRRPGCPIRTVPEGKIQMKQRAGPQGHADNHACQCVPGKLCRLRPRRLPEPPQEPQCHRCQEEQAAENRKCVIVAAKRQDQNKQNRKDREKTLILIGRSKTCCHTDITYQRKNHKKHAPLIHAPVVGENCCEHPASPVEPEKHQHSEKIYCSADPGMASDQGQMKQQEPCQYTGNQNEKPAERGAVSPQNVRQHPACGIILRGIRHPEQLRNHTKIG